MLTRHQRAYINTENGCRMYVIMLLVGKNRITRIFSMAFWQMCLCLAHVAFHSPTAYLSAVHEFVSPFSYMVEKGSAIRRFGLKACLRMALLFAIVNVNQSSSSAEP